MPNTTFIVNSKFMVNLSLLPNPKLMLNSIFMAWCIAHKQPAQEGLVRMAAILDSPSLIMDDQGGNVSLSLSRHCSPGEVFVAEIKRKYKWPWKYFRTPALSISCSGEAVRQALQEAFPSLWGNTWKWKSDFKSKQGTRSKAPSLAQKKISFYFQSQIPRRFLLTNWE